MTDFILKIKKDFINKKTCLLLLSTFLFGVLIYIVLISNDLTNQYDGLWVDSYYYCGNWELSNGRWLWRYIDMLKQGHNANPLNSYLALMIFSIGNILLVESIGFKRNFSKYFVCFGILTTTTICCFLSYRYLAEKYAISYLFSVLAAYVLINYKNKYVGIFISSISYMMSLASYQSEVSCFCIIIITFLLTDYFSDKFDIKNHLMLIIEAVLVIVIGSLLYKVSWDIMSQIYNTPPSSYKGGNSLSIGNMILNIPKNIFSTYKYFYNYFCGHFKINIFQNKLFYLIYFVLITYFVLIIIKHKTIFFYPIILILLLPVACNFSVLYIDSGVKIQQTIGTSIITFILITLVYEINTKEELLNKIYKYSLYVLSIILLVGNIFAVENDIEAMKIGKQSTSSLLSSISNTLLEKDLYDEKKIYCFVGKPCNNALFRANELWGNSNDYARFGDFDMSCFANTHSFIGLFENDIRINYKIEYPENIYEVANKMTAYPERGSITEIGNFVIIKLSSDECNKDIKME